MEGNRYLIGLAAGRLVFEDGVEFLEGGAGQPFGALFQQHGGGFGALDGRLDGAVEAAAGQLVAGDAARSRRRRLQQRRRVIAVALGAQHQPEVVAEQKEKKRTNDDFF